jgi:hypothetical protein
MEGFMPRVIPFTFTTYFDIDDPKALVQAARERAVQEGLTPTMETAREFVRDGAVFDAVIILMDPGTLPGCTIHSSEVE